MINKEEIVKRLYDLIEIKKSEIAKAEKPKWETNCSFKYNKDSGQSINLQVCTSIEDLVEILSFLFVKNQSFNDAAKFLGVSIKFKWLGFTLDEWVSDIKTRISKLEITSKKKELEALEERLNKLEITKEMREEMELAAIEKLLKND